MARVLLSMGNLIETLILLDYRSRHEKSHPAPGLVCGVDLSPGPGQQSFSGPRLTE